MYSEYSGVLLEYLRSTRSTLEYSGVLRCTPSTLGYFRSTFRVLGVLWSTYGVPSEYSGFLAEDNNRKLYECFNEDLLPYLLSLPIFKRCDFL